MALAMKAAAFALTCVAAIPATIAVTTIVTAWWFEKRYLPSIAGDD